MKPTNRHRLPPADPRQPESGTDPAPTITNPRRLKFALLLLAGAPAGRAYEQAGFSQRGARADSAGARLRHHPEISAFIRHEQRKAAEANRLERWQLVEWLQSAILTPVGEIDEKSPLAQEVEDVTTATGCTRRRVKSVGKLEAAKQLAALLGWTAPDAGGPAVITVVIGGDEDRG
jgi:hypothetical protein